jgi:hypothetical protein
LTKDLTPIAAAQGFGFLTAKAAPEKAKRANTNNITGINRKKFNEDVSRHLKQKYFLLFP